MSALDDARAAAEEARALIDALEEVADFGEDSFADLKQAVNRLFNTLAPSAAPPTDDEREALSEFLFSVYDHGTQPNALREADAILTFLSNRRRGPISDEQIDLAARSLAKIGDTPWADVDVWGGTWEEWRDLYHAKARAALEAAEAKRR